MKSKTKKRLLRLFNLIMIVFILLNVMTSFGVLGGKSNATDVWRKITNNSDMSNVPILQLQALLTGLTWIFTLIIKLIIIGIGAILQLIMTGVYNGFESGSGTNLVTPEDIIFSGTSGHSEFLSVDFLDGNSSGLAGTFRTSVAQWYYTLRLIAAGGLLIILIYVGIKMALSTIGKDQARYKEMFMDWVSSVALLFMLHWIIAFVITVNNALMTGLSSASRKCNLYND